MKNKITYLSFGLLPTVHGGKHKSGIGVASFELNNALSKYTYFNNFYASFDYRKKRKKINGLQIIGLHYFSLVLFIIKHLKTSFKLFINAIKVSRKYKLNKIKIFTKLLFFQKNIIEFNPKIIEFNGSLDILLSKYLIIKNRYIVGRIHGINNNPNLFKKELSDIENDLNNVKIDLLTFVSTKIKNDWEKSYGKIKKSSVLLNGFNKEIFYVSSNKLNNNNVITLITIGNISKRKGQKRVIQSLTKINNKSKYSYICYGKDQEGLVSEMKSLAKENQIKFQYYGFIPPNNVRGKLSNADFFIMPSMEEGFGLVFIESIACGTPIIVPKHLPIAQENNLLNEKNSISINDWTVNSIVQGLQDFKRSSFNRNEVSASIQHLTWENIAIEYFHLLKEML